MILTYNLEFTNYIITKDKDPAKGKRKQIYSGDFPTRNEPDLTEEKLTKRRLFHY